MKILYAIQGTGNGHISRARDIIPLLQKKADLDILVSGIQADVDLPHKVKYKYKGLSFVFGRNGGIDLINTYKKSSLKNLYREIQQLPIREYDLVINDFEPVSAWAAKINNVPCIGLSHQAAVINNKSPKPKKKDLIGKLVLKHYAPVETSYGFHFRNYDKNIFTPVIRDQIRKLKPDDSGHYTVYLPAYGNEKIINILSKIEDVNWQVFSKHTNKEKKFKNVLIKPISNEGFIESFSTCSGILCGAGFETPAEALFLKKKLMVIPMKGQYEQQCNAASLKEMGVPVIKSLKNKHLVKIREWISVPQTISVHYQNETDEILNMIIANQKRAKNTTTYELGKSINSFKKLKEKTIGKILLGLSKG